MPLSAIVGHRRLVALLSRAVARGTLPPSLLFAGPAGVGKRRAAVAVAEAINCLAPRVAGSLEPGGRSLERDACGECAACKRIGRGVHPDVIVIEPGESGSIKIDQVRDVIAQAGFRPFEGHRRVVVIDNAEALVDAAQNALLKTLEEPPSASLFILVSSVPDSLLPTVQSRCPRLRFAPLSPADVAASLMRDHGYDEADARAAAADADGSIGRALAAASVDLTEAREMAASVLQQAARGDDPARRLDAVKELTGKAPRGASERDQMAACLRAMASLLRDLGVLATQSGRHALANADLVPRLEPLTRTFTGERSMRAYTAVDQALAALERNASPKIVADWLVLQL